MVSSYKPVTWIYTGPYSMTLKVVDIKAAGNELRIVM